MWRPATPSRSRRRAAAVSGRRTGSEEVMSLRPLGWTAALALTLTAGAVLAQPAPDAGLDAALKTLGKPSTATTSPAAPKAPAALPKATPATPAQPKTQATATP